MKCLRKCEWELWVCMGGHEIAACVAATVLGASCLSVTTVYSTALSAWPGRSLGWHPVHFKFSSIGHVLLWRQLKIGPLYTTSTTTTNTTTNSTNTSMNTATDTTTTNTSTNTTTTTISTSTSITIS